MNLDQGPHKYGFYTTRFVEAEDSKEAENIAVEIIKNDNKLKPSVLNEKSNPPKIYVEEIVELDSFDDIKTPGGGYTFYPEND